MKINKLSIIIPAFNEADTIHLILNKILSVTLTNNIKKEVIIVDDASTDKTVDKIKKYIEDNPKQNIKYFFHKENKGKGAALKTGISKASGELLIIQDADLEYDPTEYNLLLQPVIDGFADVVYGSRFIGSQQTRVLYFWHTLGNKFLTILSNMFTNLNLTDMECCYKVFKKDVIKDLEIISDGFEIEPEITAKLSRNKNIRIFEVPITINSRGYKDGKKVKWWHFFSYIYSIVKWILKN